MVQSRLDIMKTHKHQQGFTLIEVLIALAILSIALTAIIKATSENLQNTFYLQQKTISGWVGNLIMNEALAGVIKITGNISGSTDMLGQSWAWQASLTTTPNPHISKIHVTVFGKNNAPLSNRESYVYTETAQAQ